jgi:hypothetical protein
MCKKVCKLTLAAGDEAVVDVVAFRFIDGMAVGLVLGQEQ